MPKEGEGLLGPPRPYSMIALRLGRRLTENQGSGNTLHWGSFGTLARRLLDSMRSCRLALGFVSLRGFGVLLMQRHHFRRKLGSFRINLFRRVDGVRSSRSRLSIFESLGSFVAFSPRDPAAVGFVRRIFATRSTRRWARLAQPITPIRCAIFRLHQSRRFYRFERLGWIRMRPWFALLFLFAYWLPSTSTECIPHLYDRHKFASS
jgi:hypothetical protein